MLVWLALVVFRGALAQEPADEVQDGIGAEGIYEVRVYGPDALREARQAIVDDMEAHGWRLVDDGANMRFRGPRAWMGVATVTSGGLLSFDAPLVGLQDGSPEALEAARGPSAQRWLAKDTFQYARFPGLDTPSGLAANGAQPGEVEVTLQGPVSKRKLDGARDDMIIGVEGSLRTYRDVLQETAFQDVLAGLERDLWALWELGIPFERGTGHVESRADRRVAALTYWAGVGDTPHGHRICDVIEGWLSLNVMTSEAPITSDEAAAAEQAALATHHRRLPFRWDGTADP